MDWFKSQGLKIKILLAVFGACLICALASVVTGIYFNGREFRKGLIERSRTIHSRLNAASQYVANQGGLTPMIERYTQLYKDSSQLTDEDKKIILQQVPIYAAMKIGAAGADKENYQFRVFSNEPRNKDNAATAAEMEIFKKFENDPKLPELDSDDGKTVTVYRPVRLRESFGCLTCHGDPATSPWGNGRDILGHKMENWKDGKLHGVFAVSNNIETLRKAAAANGEIPSTYYLAFFIFVGSLFALILAALVIRQPIAVLQRVSKTLGEAGEQVRAAANQIASSSQSLSQASSEQATSLEETVSTMDEMTSMVQINTDNAKEAAAVASSTRAVAAKAEKEISMLIESIQSIAADSKKVVEITAVIDDIAFQTNLLALNAAVEAARAGEQGKGFAVVAEAVRSLAQRSADAAKDIATLINESVGKIEQGANQANQGGVVLAEIVTAVKKVADLNGEIAMASQEQSKGIGQISSAMNQLDQATQQNAAVSEESAVSAEELSSQAESLKSTVVSLEGVVFGRARP